MQSDLRQGGAPRPHRPFVDEQATPVLGDSCPLARPGILLDMVTPAAADQMSAPQRDPYAVFAIIATGSAIGSSWLLASASAHAELPFGEAGGWWATSVAAAALLAVGLRARVHTGTTAAMVGALATAMLAVTAVTFACGMSSVALPLLLLALGSCVGLLPGGGLAASATAGVFGIVLWLWNGHDLAAAMGPLAMLAVGSAVVALGLVALVSRRWHVPVRVGPPRLRVQAAALGIGGGLLALLPSSAFGITATGTVALVAVPALACGIALVGGRLGLIALTSAAWLVVGWAALPTSLNTERALVIAAHGAAAVHYQRADQQLALFDGGECIDAVGPDRVEAPLLATLARAFGAIGDRVAVLGLGSGKVHGQLDSLGCFALDAVDWRPDAQTLRPRLLGCGPVESGDLHAPPVRRFSGLVAAVAALRPGSRQLLVLGEPLSMSVPCSFPVQQAMRNAVGTGLVLQAAALDRVSPQRLQQWFAAAVDAHAWNGLFIVGDAAVLVSAAERPAVGEPLPQWSEAARWLAHSAHLGSAEDVLHALVGTLRKPREMVALAPAATAGRAAVLPVLHAWLQPEAAPAATAGDSLLWNWTAQQAELRRQVAIIRGLDGSEEARGKAQAIALRFLPQGAPHPVLQAALGVAGADAIAVLSPMVASRRAFALDPTYFDTVPAVCAALPTVQQARGELEDLAQLPPTARLVALCSDDTPLAIALRVRFPSACAQALVAKLAVEMLSPAEAGALRELADAFVLREAERGLVARGALRELLGIWRHDLDPPAALAVLAQRSSADRAALATALRGRRLPSCWLLLAALLEAGEIEVRSIAGEVLRDCVAVPIPYEPQWPQSARHEAAERLRSLHNRTP